MAPYRRIVADIRRQIADGTLPPRARLPTRVRLAAAYGVSLSVVDRAMLVLREAGDVATWPGKGAYVAEETARRSRA